MREVDTLDAEHSCFFSKEVFRGAHNMFSDLFVNSKDLPSAKDLDQLYEQQSKNCMS
jgi:hypothetical protein